MDNSIICSICGVETGEYVILAKRIHHKDPMTCIQNNRDSRDLALIEFGRVLGRQK